MKFFFIYKTTNLITGKFYIGAHTTRDLDDGYLGSGLVLKNSINKWGLENHIREILQFLPDSDSLYSYEHQLVNEDLLNDPCCMNLKVGGKGGTHGREKEMCGRIGYKGRMSEIAKRLWSNPEFRKKIMESKRISSSKPEVKQKISVSSKRMWQSEEYRQKFQERKHEIFTEEYKQKMSEILKETWSDPNLKREASRRSKAVWANDEFKEDMKHKKKLYMNTPEYKQKMSESVRLARKKKIDGMIFDIRESVDFSLDSWQTAVGRITKSKRPTIWINKHMPWIKFLV